jgi:hypothetical protein
VGSDKSVADFTPEQQAAIDAAVAEQVEGLKKNQNELLKESKAAKAKLAAYDGVDPEEYKKLKQAAEEAERKRLQGEGDFKQLEQQLVKKYEGLLEQERGSVSRMRSAMEKHLIDSAALSELAKVSDSPKLLLPHIRGRMKVVEHDGEFHARIVDDSGNIRVGKGQGSSPMTLSELIEEMKSDKEFAPAFRGTGSSGGGATKSTGGAGGSRTIAAHDNAGFLANLESIAKGEVTVTGL